MTFFCAEVYPAYICIRLYSRLRVHYIPKKLALPCFSKILLVSCHTIFLGQILMGILKKQLKMQNLTHFLRYGDALYISYIISANVEFSAYLLLIVKIIGNVPKYLYKTLYLWSKPTNLIWKLVLLLLCKDTEILQSCLSNFCSGVNKKKFWKKKNTVHTLT